jgi:hypothetical protein
MKLHPLRHNVVLLAAFLAGAVAMQVALGDVRMFGLLPVIGVLIGLNLRYNRRSERGRTRIDERYDRIIQSGALVGFVAMLHATVGYAFYVSMTDGTSVSEEPVLLSFVGLVSIVLVSGYYWLSRKVSGVGTDQRTMENELKSSRGNHELVQACPEPTACRGSCAGP